MVQVKVKEGLLEGEVVQNEFGGSFCSFKGIPYAAPPLGDLRFKAPKPNQPWDGVRSAKEFGPKCFQVDLHNLTAPPIGSEDCLYLNVHTPDISPIKPLPVMFYIHGGGFISGSGNEGPEFLIRHGVVLVTFNYRLEALGFLCLDTKDISGNAGMKDQVAALRWVKENISSFGGDPDNITIFGHSAGGCCVSYHLISPMTKGLFRGAIVQSGAFTCPWAKVFEPRERALALARKLGLDSEDNKELYEFFKSVPVESLVAIHLPITFSEKGAESFELIFSIVDEKHFDGNERFIYGDLNEILRNGGIHKDVDIMIGYTEDEGLICLKAEELEKKFLHANEFREFFVPRAIAENCKLRDHFEVGRRIKKYYFGDSRVDMNTIDQLIKFYSLNAFVFGIFQLVKSFSHRVNVYLYKFTGKSERNIMVNVLGLKAIVGDKTRVCHADELNYIFPIPNITVDRNSKSFKMIDHMTKLWTNFAKHGNPTPDDKLGINWTPYNLNDQHYLNISENLVMGTAPDKDKVAFWENIYKEFLPSAIPYKNI